MRTLGEIIEVCHDGGEATADEMRLAIVAFSHLQTLDFSTAARPCCDSPVRVSRSERSFSRRKAAYAAAPDVWLGETYNPDRPEVQARRARSKRIAEAAGVL